MTFGFYVLFGFNQVVKMTKIISGLEWYHEVEEKSTLVSLLENCILCSSPI